MSFKQLEIIKPELLNDKVVSSYFTLKNPEAVDGIIPGLNLGFNTEEENSKINANRTLLFGELGITEIATAKQIHSRKAIYVTKGGIYNNVDGLVTDCVGLALGIQVADCGALIFVDTQQKVIGVAHAGWRGAVSGIIENTIDLMIRRGAKSQNIKVFLGPCISEKNFEVGIEVAEQFPDSVVDYKNYDKPHVDLVSFIRDKLEGAGIQKSYIQVDGRCTIEMKELFYSYRREKEKSGRMMGIVKLNDL